MLLINCKNHLDKINHEVDGQEIVSVTVLPQYTYLWDKKIIKVIMIFINHLLVYSSFAFQLDEELTTKELYKYYLLETAFDQVQQPLDIANSKRIVLEEDDIISAGVLSGDEL